MTDKLDEQEAERRRFQRIERSDPIRIKLFTFPEGGSYEEAHICDLSAGGLHIETKHFFAEKSLLKIEMNFTGWQRYTPTFLKYFGDAATKPLVVLAEVVRCQSLMPGVRYEAAVNFTGIDESERRALLRFIRDHMHGPKD